MNDTIVQQDGRFRFSVPMYAFEKGDAPEGRRRRIGGLVSTETRDRENEVILQDGLDFSEFLHHGWYNDNHGKSMLDAVGEPDPTALRRVRKGERLPNGLAAPANGHWAEGWMIEGTKRADDIWNQIVALQKSPTRRLGFSIEGAIQKRAGHDLKTIAKAKVRHVAITHVPVNTDTRLDALAKSMRGDEHESPAEQIAEAGVFLGVDAYRGAYPDGCNPDIAGLQARAALGAVAELAEGLPFDGILDMDLGAGRPQVDPYFSTPHAHSVAPAVVDGMSSKALTSVSGRALLPQSLERDLHPYGVKKSLSAAEAIGVIRSRFPHISYAAAGRVLDTLIFVRSAA